MDVPLVPLFTIFCIVGIAEADAAGATVRVTGTTISKLAVPSVYWTSRSPVISVELLTAGRPNVTVTVPSDSAPKAVTLAVLRVRIRSCAEK